MPKGGEQVTSQLSESNWAMRSDSVQRAVYSYHRSHSCSLFCRQSRSLSCSVVLYLERWSQGSFLDMTNLQWGVTRKGSLLSAQHFLAGTSSSWYLCGKLWLTDVMFSILWESKLVFESIWMTTYISFFGCLYCTYFYSENNCDSL